MRRSIIDLIQSRKSAVKKSIKHATKAKIEPPNAKYIESILLATHASKQGVIDVNKLLQKRLCRPEWMTVFKSLIIIHLMIREGEPDVVMPYLSHNLLENIVFEEGMKRKAQGRNINTYSEYLIQRVTSYSLTNFDFIRANSSHVRSLGVDGGLISGIENLQELLKALLRCNFFTFESENAISLAAFRLLVLDLLSLFRAVSEGMANILHNFLQMSKEDAYKAVQTYRVFVEQVESIETYFSSTQEQLSSIGVEIPIIKKTSTILVDQLKNYVMDPEFQTVEHQYSCARDGTKVSSELIQSDTEPSRDCDSDPEPNAPREAPDWQP
ncbi:uncharacterized protein PV09_09591 [Verruconis gallopava]|uniref:ENTH domain-containing protein n=1 Tax=Verruconis gallopava TaxID=253628 RepID=A0A0D2AI80_9PEZI|nr:uncharacterized protein PV09_09591 [Verruconis gallopava]KIV98623.1 hypothetical protein PV09_09591 [Verruconis gallopava]